MGNITQEDAIATFNQGLTWVQWGIYAFGFVMIIYGLVTLGGGLREKNGPDIKQGILTIIGGVIIVLAGSLVNNVKL